MTTHELLAMKAVALTAGGVAAASTVAASLANSLPIEAVSVSALVGAAVGYGVLRGRLEERVKSDDARHQRISAAIQRLTATVDLIAEKQGIPIAHLKSDFQTGEL